MKGGGRKHGWARRRRRQTPMQDTQILGQFGGVLPIIQSKHMGCPREAVSWGEVALCRGRPLELTVGGVC